jgi:hypothetical protein
MQPCNSASFAPGSIPGSCTIKKRLDIAKVFTLRSGWSSARLDSRDSCGSLGSAKALEIHPASGKQIVNAAL